MIWLELVALVGSFLNVIISLKLKRERVLSIGLLIIVIVSVIALEGRL